MMRIATRVQPFFSFGGTVMHYGHGIVGMGGVSAAEAPSATCAD